MFDYQLALWTILSLAVVFLGTVAVSAVKQLKPDTNLFNFNDVPP